MKASLKILISLGLCAFLLHRLYTPGLRTAIVEFRGTDFLTGFAFLALLPALQGLRWLAVARSLGISTTIYVACSLAYVGAFFSQILPSTVGGDAVTVLRLYQAGYPGDLVIEAALLDRVMALQGLLVTACLGFVGSGWSTMPHELALSLALFSVIGVGLGAVLLMVDRLPLPSTLATWAVIRKVRRIGPDARRAASSPGTLAIALGASSLSHLSMSAAFWHFGNKFGLGADFPLCVAIVPLVTFASIIPISVAGWGIREAAVVLAFQTVGANLSAVLAASILLGFATACAALPGAFIGFRGMRTAGMPR